MVRIEYIGAWALCYLTGHERTPFSLMKDDYKAIFIFGVTNFLLDLVVTS